MKIRRGGGVPDSTRLNEGAPGMDPGLPRVRRGKPEPDRVRRALDAQTGSG
jgi:hypothetical protein